jgi:hypothetical protein
LGLFSPTWTRIQAELSGSELRQIDSGIAKALNWIHILLIEIISVVMAKTHGLRDERHSDGKPAVRGQNDDK